MRSARFSQRESASATGRRIVGTRGVHVPNAFADELRHVRIVESVVRDLALPTELNEPQVPKCAERVRDRRCGRVEQRGQITHAELPDIRRGERGGTCVEVVVKFLD